MKRWIQFTTLAFSVLFFGCSSAPEDSPTGDLSVGLTASSPQGNLYRLRDATFQISSIEGPVAAISSETDPDAETIDVSVAPGFYEIRLLPGWRLERADPGGDVPVAARLISPSVVFVEVESGATVPVIFRFETDGTVISTGGGEINIGIDVEETLCPIDPVCDDGNACTFDECNPMTGECEFFTLPNGSFCQLMGIPGACTDGVCLPVEQCGGDRVVDPSATTNIANLECNVMGIGIPLDIGLAAAPLGMPQAGPNDYNLQMVVRITEETVNLLLALTNSVTVDFAVGTVEGTLGSTDPNPQPIAEAPVPCDIALFRDTAVEFVTPTVEGTWIGEGILQVLTLSDLNAQISAAGLAVPLTTEGIDANCVWAIEPPNVGFDLQ